MGYTTFKNNEQPALSDTVLNNMQVELMKMVFPIGSTYITQENTNPSEILKFGTWERLKGKVVVGLDEDDTDLNTIGKIGGEKTHQLTINEMPRHDHPLYLSSYQVQNVTNSGVWVAQYREKEHDIYSLPNGGDKAHNNMQPYEIVGYMWIRRS